MREGRAALVTSFGMFKFMALYAMIQFISITILYSYVSNLSDYGFLYIDLIVIDLIMATMSRNHAYKKLTKTRPPSSLVATEMIASLLFQILLQLAFQFGIIFLLEQQCWVNEGDCCCVLGDDNTIIKVVIYLLYHIWKAKL